MGEKINIKALQMWSLKKVNKPFYDVWGVSHRRSQDSSHTTCAPLTSSQCRRHMAPPQPGQTPQCRGLGNLQFQSLSLGLVWNPVRQPWPPQLPQSSPDPGTERRFQPGPCWHSSQVFWSRSSCTWDRQTSCCGSSSPADRLCRSCGRMAWRQVPQTPPDRWSSWTAPRRGVGLLESSRLQEGNVRVKETWSRPNET